MNPMQIKTLAGKLAKAQTKLASQQAEVAQIQRELAQAIGLSAAPAPVKTSRRGRPPGSKNVKPAKAAVRKGKGKRAPRGAVTQAILEIAGSKENFRVADVVTKLASQGVGSAPASVAIAVNKQLKINAIKRVGRGLYAKA